MTLLSDVPSIPDNDELARLQSAFFTSFKQHIFLETIAIPDSTLSSPAPYLQLALACLASEIAPYTDPMNYNFGMGQSHKTEISSDIFYAGVKLWAVIMEVDNRETRRLEAVITVRIHSFGKLAMSLIKMQAYLFATYGMLSTHRHNWQISCSVLHNTATVSLVASMA